ncbi:hypothetical protein LguiA_017733 [Lonicera macranthoides]
MDLDVAQSPESVSTLLHCLTVVLDPTTIAATFSQRLHHLHSFDPLYFMICIERFDLLWGRSSPKLLFKSSYIFAYLFGSRIDPRKAGTDPREARTDPRPARKRVEGALWSRSKASLISTNFDVASPWILLICINAVEGGSAALVELVAVAHAACARFDTVVSERALELVGRALVFELRHLLNENDLWIRYADFQEPWTSCSTWTERLELHPLQEVELLTRMGTCMLVNGEID